MASLIGNKPNQVPTNGDLGNLAFQNADNIAGPVGIGGAVTLFAGTANGVPYLNASKVLTSGSALTFDGTNLGVGTAAAASKLMIGGSGANRISFGAPSGTQYVGYDGTTDILGIASYNDIRFQVNAYNEAMRLTSTGLGIGATSTNNSRLRIFGTTNAETRLQLFRSGNIAASLWAETQALKFGVDGTDGSTELMQLNSSGNLGLGVTPTAGTGDPKHIEIPSGGIFRSQGTAVDLGANYYYNSGYTYITTAAATRFEQNSGAFKFYTAPSGTAGTAITFTQAMTLDASGVLTVGAASNQNLIVTSTSSSSYMQFANSGGITGYIGSSGAINSGGGNNALGFRSQNEMVFATGGSTERARIDSSGNLIQSAPTTPPTLSTNGTMVFNLTSNTNLRISVRGSDGVTRTANITLA